MVSVRHIGISSGGHICANAYVTPAFTTAIAGQKVPETFPSWMSRHDLAKLQIRPLPTVILISCLRGGRSIGVELTIDT